MPVVLSPASSVLEKEVGLEEVVGEEVKSVEMVSPAFVSK